MPENRRFTRRGLLALVGGGVGPALAGCQGGPASEAETSATRTKEETSSSDSTTTQENTAPRNSFRPGRDDWPQFQHEARNTGSHPESTGPGGALEERWSYHIGAESMVSMGDSTVYSTVRAGRISALGLQDGELLWTSSASGYSSSIESVSGRLFTSQGNWIHELNPENGDIAERTQLPSPIANDRLASHGQTLYVGTINGVVHAIDSRTKEEIWQYDTGAIPNLHVTERTVFVGNSREAGGVLHAIDRSDGSLRWEFVTAEPSPGIPRAPTTDAETVFVGNDGGWFYAIDKDSGAEKWQTRIRGSIHAQPTVGESRVYLGLRGFPRGFIEALDVATGDSEWRVTLDGTGWESAEVWTSPQLVEDTLLVGADNGLLYGLDRGNGEKSWQYDTGNKIRSLGATADGVLLGNLDAETYRVTAGGSEEWHHVGESIPIWSTPIVGDGTVFVGGTDAQFHAIEEASGEREWAVQTEQPVVGGSVYSEGRVYLQATKTGAFDAESGSIEWSFRPMSFGVTAPAFDDGVLYACETSEIVDFNLYAADVSEGEVLWEQGTESRLLATPAVADGVVCTGSQSGVAYGFDAGTGEILWEYPTGDRLEAGPTIDEGIVYVGSRDGRIYALDLQNGSPQWEHRVNEPIVKSPALDEETLYVPAGQSLIALDTTTQAERWRVAVEGGTAPAIGEGILYIGDRTGRVQALDMETGDMITSFDTGEGPIKAPVVAVNGSVYVGGADGRVYGLDAGL